MMNTMLGGTACGQFSAHEALPAARTTELVRPLFRARPSSNRPFKSHDVAVVADGEEEFASSPASPVR